MYTAMEEKHQAAIAQNTRDENVLRQLVKSSKVYVRISIAINPYTPLDAQIELVKDKSYEVRWWLASNTKHAVVIDLLMQDGDPHVVKHLVSNPNITDNHCIQLAQHNSVVVRWQLSDRCRLPVEAVKILMQDEDIRVRDMVKKYTLVYPELNAS